MLEFEFIPILACGPALMVAQMFIAVASAAASHAAAKQTEKATLKYQAGKSKNAMLMEADRATALAKAHNDEQEATVRAVGDIEKNTMVAAGRARASAADAGVSGASYMLQQQEFEAWGAQLEYSEMMNAKSSTNRYHQAMTSAGLASQAGQLNILRPVHSPSGVAAGLAAGAGVLGAAGGALEGNYAPKWMKDMQT